MFRVEGCSQFVWMKRKIWYLLQDCYSQSLLPVFSCEGRIERSSIKVQEPVPEMEASEEADDSYSW